MSVPSRRAAAALLLSLDPPAWHLRHSRVVAEVAAFLASRAAARGERVDRHLVEAAALLHDVDKSLPANDPAATLPHGQGSAAWLAARGHAELGPAVSAHTVTRLVDGDADAWLDSATLEELLVAYADKRAGQRRESMASRFAGWRRRYPGGWSDAADAAARARADRLEREACRRAGLEAADVRRLAWTGAALRAARRAAGDPEAAA